MAEVRVCPKEDGKGNKAEDDRNAENNSQKKQNEVGQGNSQKAGARTPQVVHRNYRCKQCSFTTTKSRLFLAHRRSAHGDTVKVYPCDLCDYASKYKSKLLRHRNLKHKGAGEYSEENAGYMSEETANDLLRNAASHIHIAFSETEASFTGGAGGNSLTIAWNRPLNQRSFKVQQHRSVAAVDDTDVWPGKEEALDEFEQQEEESTMQIFAGSTEEETLEVNGDSDNEESSETPNFSGFISESRDLNGKPVSQCALCNFSSPHKSEVADHLRSFHMAGKRLQTAPKYDFAPGRKVEMCLHRAQQPDSSKTHSYDVLPTFNNGHEFRSALRGPVRCSYCSFAAHGDAALTRHMWECHPKNAASTTPRKTRLGFPSLSGQDATDRRSNVIPAHQHSSREGVKDFCFSTFQAATENPTTRLLPIAGKRSHQVASAANGGVVDAKKSSGGKSGNEVDCQVCGITFRTEARLRIHMVSHSTEATHHCPLCSLKYKRTSDLNRHMKKKHGSKLRDYNNLASQDQPLNLSVKATEAFRIEGPAFCRTVCGEDQPLDLSTKPRNQAVPSLPSTAVHSATKPSRGPYNPDELKCGSCSYLAKWPSDLKRHALVHSMEKRYKCEQCGRRYKYQFDLNMHMRRSHHVTTSGRSRLSSTKAATAVPRAVGRVVPRPPPIVNRGMSLPTRVIASSPKPKVKPETTSPPSPQQLSSASSACSSPRDVDGDVDEDPASNPSPLASLRPLLLAPSPPAAFQPIEVVTPREVVFAPSSVHDMENTLPPSMRRVADPHTTPLMSSQTAASSDVRVPSSPSLASATTTAAAHKPADDGADSLRPSCVTSPEQQEEPRPPRPLKLKAMKPQRPSSLTPARKFKCQYCPYLGLYQSEVSLKLLSFESSFQMSQNSSSAFTRVHLEADLMPHLHWNEYSFSFAAFVLVSKRVCSPLPGRLFCAG